MTIGAATVRTPRARPAVSWTSWFGPPRWSLAQQYVVASLIVVLAGVLVTGAWIGHQIETSVLDRTAGITALYVDSFLSGSLQGLAQDDRWLTPTDTAALDRLISDTGLGEGVVLFKIWSLDGRVLYSPDRTLVGQRFPVDGGLASAADGEVRADMTTLEQPENTNERGRYNRLVEVYAPVREDNGPRIIAVNEFYLLPDALDAEIRDAQLRSWGVVAAIGLITYLVLAGIVKRGSDTIRKQQAELRQRLDQNLRLHERVRQAARRTTALNEQALRRISADLHDGPGQVLALALLRLDALQMPFEAGDVRAQTRSDFATVHAAVRDALTEVRAISAGLRLPELSSMSVTDVALRAIDDHQRRSGTHVERQLENLPGHAALATKIALVRTLQEALSNATRHAAGQQVTVHLVGKVDSLLVEVSDRGAGFDPHRAEHSGRLGLAGMRERAELLGGTFEVESTLGRGTLVRVCWPLHVREEV